VSALQLAPLNRAGTSFEAQYYGRPVGTVVRVAVNRGGWWVPRWGACDHGGQGTWRTAREAGRFLADLALAEWLHGFRGYGWIGEAEDRTNELLQDVAAILGRKWEGITPLDTVASTIGCMMKYLGIRGEALRAGEMIDRLMAASWDARRNLDRGRDE